MSDKKRTAQRPPKFCQVCGIVIDKRYKRVYWDNGWICSPRCRFRLTTKQRNSQPKVGDAPADK